jgi:SAM-dependent methyltransferase
MSDANREQVEFWNGRSALRWVVHQEILDRVIHPIGDAALERAAVLPGERVIDVGCGCGGPTLELAAKVGPSGSVLGIDVSEPLLGVARERARRLGVGNLELVLADASSHAFDGNAHLVFSRVGVMFFGDPVGAFANLRRALRPGGRVVFVCFRDRELNPWMMVPRAAVATVVGPDRPTPPNEPGPFSLSKEARVREVLGAAGFVGVVCEPIDHDLALGVDVDAATDFSVDAGPAARLLIGASDELRARARAAVRQAMAPYATPRGVSLRAATWVVQARNPASVP